MRSVIVGGRALKLLSDVRQIDSGESRRPRRESSATNDAFVMVVATAMKDVIHVGGDRRFAGDASKCDQPTGHCVFGHALAFSAIEEETLAANIELQDEVLHRVLLVFVAAVGRAIAAATHQYCDPMLTTRRIGWYRAQMPRVHGP